jgi:hypothetical protein
MSPFAILQVFKVSVYSVLSVGDRPEEVAINIILTRIINHAYRLSDIYYLKLMYSRDFFHLLLLVGFESTGSWSVSESRFCGFTISGVASAVAFD